MRRFFLTSVFIACFISAGFSQDCVGTTCVGFPISPDCDFPCNYCFDGICLYLLPVELISIEVVDKGYPTVQWKTASEINVVNFEVEIGFENESKITYTILEKVLSKGSKGVISDYEVTDLSRVDGRIRYYRLQEVDKDGIRTELGSVVFDPKSSNNDYLSLSPNPFQESFIISLLGYKVERMKFNIYSVYGELILEKDCIASDGYNTFQFDNLNIAPGLYFVKILSKERNTTMKVLKQ